MVIISSPKFHFSYHDFTAPRSYSIFLSFFMTFVFFRSPFVLIQLPSLRTCFPYLSCFFCSIKSFQCYKKTKDLMLKTSKRKNTRGDTEHHSKKSKWQNELPPPFVGEFFKESTTIATAILDLARCRQRLSALNFQCDSCMCVCCFVCLSSSHLTQFVLCMWYFSIRW